MLRSQVLLVALFVTSVLLVEVNGAPRRDDMHTLREYLANDKDLAHLLLLTFASELLAANADEMLPELEEDEEDEEGVREEVMRRRHLPLTQRERKAGCRNFFWKTFTSC